jgi:hypothetical protein
MRPYLKNTQHTQKRASGVGQVIEHPLSKCKVLSANPSINKKKIQVEILSKGEDGAGDRDLGLSV